MKALVSFPGRRMPGRDLGQAAENREHGGYRFLDVLFRKIKASAVQIFQPSTGHLGTILCRNYVDHEPLRAHKVGIRDWVGDWGSRV